jgi:SAM-dependent methyltransferase
MNDLRTTSLTLGKAVLRRLAIRHPAWVAELVDPVHQGSVAYDDEAFVERVYTELLGRPVDRDGRAFHVKALANGLTRADLVLAIAQSDEYRLRCRHAGLGGSGQGPRFRSPEKYRFISELSLWTFNVSDPVDFDWIENAILTDGYYEQPGVWNLGVDTDKRVMAEIVASLSAGRVLEIGCASGAVLEGLYERGLSFEGIDISSMAVARASERVRDHIHQGDVLSIDMGHDFDTVFGLDIFEHLNPNRLSAYIERLRSCLVASGLLFANIPAFGRDAVFGEVFPYYLRGWDTDAATGRCFRTLHVDDDGYPLHGHLVWADTRWWVEQFETAGFIRAPSVEAALHRKYDEYMKTESPARRSFYVFAAGVLPDEKRIIETIEESPSLVLSGASG